MCGIVGIVDSRSSVSPEQIRFAADLLLRRGPDDSGVWTRENVGLGHRRLAVIDLSPAGHQPMFSSDGRFAIVFNGEIYNYRELRDQIEDGTSRWQSESDTEVILAAYEKWGTACVERFHGMFSFAIWDQQERRLFAARDRMGEKPFFYHASSLGFAFASRPRSLFALFPSLPRTLDPQAMRYFVEAGYVPTPFSIFREVRKLPPAHWLTFENGQVRVQRYWDFRNILPESAWEKRDERELLDELDGVLSRSVRQRMVSDVPLGSFLSGGIDSSLVSAIMAKASSRPIKTFTIGFDGARYDESPHAQAVAESIGSDHYCERLQAEDLLKLLPLYFQEYDEPFADSSAFPMFAVSRAARKSVTVCLGGDGGDELFGGYPYYPMVDRLEKFFVLPGFARRCTAALSGLVPLHRFQLLSSALRKQSPAEVFCFARSLTKDFPSVFRQELSRETASLQTLLLGMIATLPPGLSAADQAMRMDACCTLHDDYLQKVDVASMAFSLEAREPLLDQDVVEWSMKLPLKWKLRGGSNKYLLRKLAYRYLPKRILERPKHGFEIPLADWLRGPLHGWAAEQMRDKRAFEDLPLNQEQVLSLLELHRSGRRNVHPLLWSVLVLLQFVREQVDSIAPAPPVQPLQVATGAR